MKDTLRYMYATLPKIKLKLNITPIGTIADLRQVSMFHLKTRTLKNVHILLRRHRYFMPGVKVRRGASQNLRHESREEHVPCREEQSWVIVRSHRYLYCRGYSRNSRYHVSIVQFNGTSK
jgi:hypothetical protein